MANSDVAVLNAAPTKRRAYRLALRHREALAAYLFLTPFFFFFIVFILRAVVTAVQMSLYDWKILAATHPYVGLGNYQELMGDSRWWISLQNTIVFTLMTVTGTTILALAAAVAVNQPIKGQSFFRVLLYAPAVLSVGVVGTTWQWLFDGQFGLVNYVLSFFGIPRINWLGNLSTVLPTLSLTTIWWGFGFPMLIFLAGLQGIPDQLYEAARIDGANGRKLFRFITLPLLRPTILFVTVTGLIGNFQVFGQVYTMPSPAGGPGFGSYTVIYYLYQVALRGSFNVGYGAAIAIVLAIIISIFTITQFSLFGRRVEY